MLKDLEKKISPVLVVNNSSLKPYVELFDYAPENIYQQPLGNLVGFFEVKEYSEDSAYVVNFLTSVLRKEYYINPKRPVTESLDSALHKVNMALSELAKHGNIQWLGKLNAAICVLEKNSAHFSVAGNAKIFLYRGAGLTEISEDLASESLEPHPLKTFVNVSSGRLEKNDRLLITSEDIFHIFSILELKKNFQRFEGDKFVQFLKTALSNQMEMIASVVVEMNEEEVVKMKIPAKKKTSLAAANAFSEKTFEKTVAPATIEIGSPLIEEIPEVETSEYTDEKTGHIYVQGETPILSENPKVALFWEETKEKVAEAWYLTKNEARRKYALSKKQLAKKLEQRRVEKEKIAELKKEEEKRLQEERVLQELELEEKLSIERDEQRILAEKQEIQKQKQQALEEEIYAEEQKLLQAQVKAEEKEALKNKARLDAEEKVRKNTIVIPEIKEVEENSHEIQRELTFKEKLERAVIEEQRKTAVIDLRAPKPAEKITSEKLDENETDITLEVPIHLQSEIEQIEKERKAEARRKLMNNIQENLSKYSRAAAQASSNMLLRLKEKRNSKASSSNEKTHLTPRFSKIKKSFSYFTFQQKIYTIVGLTLVFIVPLFIVHFLNKPKKPTINELPAVIQSPTQKLIDEKNINLDTQTKAIISRNDLVGTLLTNSGAVTITKGSVIMLDSNNKEYAVPSGNGSVVKASFMSDLSLILIVTDQGKIISFSPVSLKFINNNLNLPIEPSSDFIGTYLTYLYVLDGEANQIYRYPRADGGFGEKTNWLKGGTSLSNASDMTIDDNIYVIQDNKIAKFFKGQNIPMILESSQTPIHFDRIFTNLDSSSLWVLDSQNGRIIQFSKDAGKIIAQYANEDFKNGISLSIDEKNKAAYITTSNELLSISLQ